MPAPALPLLVGGAAAALLLLSRSAVASDVGSRPGPGGGGKASRRYGVAHEEKLSARELEAIEALAAELGVEPRWLLAVMAFESKLEPSEVNRLSRATGLIQFMPSTAKKLGTTVEALRTMTRLEQLPYVRRYFAPFRGRMGSYLDTYLAVFWPAAMGESKGDAFELFRVGSKEYAQNSGLDRDRDGKVTRADVRRSISGVLRSQPAPTLAPAPSAPALPAGKDGPQPGLRRVVVLGDSLGVGIGEQLRAVGRSSAGDVRAKGATIAGDANGRQSAEPFPKDTTIVIATGTNNLGTSEPIAKIADTIEALAKKAGRDVIVWAPLHPTAKEPYAKRSAELAAELVRRLGAIEAGGGPVWVDPTPTADRDRDGIHYTPAGYRRVARALVG